MDDRAVFLAALDRAGLSRLTAKVERLMKPAILVEATRVADGEHLAVGASRFGGDPDLPPGIDWPTRDGVPMQFVAQLRLSEVAPHDVERVLPTAGWLLFFHNEQLETSEVDPQYPDQFACGRVLFWDGDEAALVPTTPPRVDYEDAYGKRIAPETFLLTALTFAPRFDTPPQVSAFLAGDDLADLRAEWPEFLVRHDRELRAGVPIDTTRAPRYNAHKILGYPASNDVDGAMGIDDVLLLQVDSDSEAGFVWGDSQLIYFIASRADVARRDFSRVRLHRELE